MDINAVFLASVLLVNGLAAIVWWTAGTWLGLSRRAAWHWMIAAAANGVALALLPLDRMLGMPSFVLVANVLVLHGLISQRRGLQAFLRLRHTDLSHAALGLGIIVFNLGLCLPLGWVTVGEVASSAAIVALLCRTAVENHRPLGEEFGFGLARAHSTLLGTASGMFVLTSLGLLPGPVRNLWQQLSPEVATFIFIFSHLAVAIMASFVSGYMVVIRLIRKLQHLSHHDSLTGLLNRRAIEYLLSRETQRLQRFSESFSVLILDIDHFKRVNDRLGHAAGDAVLCAVAQTLQAHAREVDRVARFGGEEFCVLLPHTLHDGAMQAAERLRDAVSQISIPWNDELIAVTISTGMATADNPHETMEALIQRADQALYRAKAEGRNRVVAARRFAVA